MVGEACLPSNAYYPRTPDYTLCSGVHVCWSEHSDSSFVYGFMILNYGFGTMTATTIYFRLQEVPGGDKFQIVTDSVGTYLAGWSATTSWLIILVCHPEQEDFWDVIWREMSCVFEVVKRT